jgi:hypothetical protein
VAAAGGKGFDKHTLQLIGHGLWMHSAQVLERGCAPVSKGSMPILMLCRIMCCHRCNKQPTNKGCAWCQRVQKTGSIRTPVGTHVAATWRNTACHPHGMHVRYPCVAPGPLLADIGLTVPPAALLRLVVLPDRTVGPGSPVVCRDVTHTRYSFHRLESIKVLD